MLLLLVQWASHGSGEEVLELLDSAKHAPAQLLGSLAGVGTTSARLARDSASAVARSCAAAAGVAGTGVAAAAAAAVGGFQGFQGWIVSAAAAQGQPSAEERTRAALRDRMRGKKGGSGRKEEMPQEAAEQPELVDGAAAISVVKRMSDVWQQFEQEWDTEKRGHRKAHHQLQQNQQQHALVGDHKPPQRTQPKQPEGPAAGQLPMQLRSLLQSRTGFLLAPLLVGGLAAAIMLTNRLASRPGLPDTRASGQQAATVQDQGQQQQGGRRSGEAKQELDLQAKQQQSLLDHVFQQEWLGVLTHSNQPDKKQQQGGAKEQQQAAPTSTANTSAKVQGTQPVKQAGPPSAAARAAASGAMAEHVLDAAVATDLLQQWHRARAQAFGRERATQGLQMVLLEPVLQEYQQQVEELQEKGR